LSCHFVKQLTHSRTSSWSHSSALCYLMVRCDKASMHAMSKASAMIVVPLAGLLLAGASLSGSQAGFRSPESLVRNLYAYYGDRSSELSSGLPRDADTARQFFDQTLREAWLSSRKAPYDFLVQSPTWKLGAISISILRKQFDKTYVVASFDNQGRAVIMNFVLVSGPDGWVIYDVESPHDSLRAFLAQYKNQGLNR
jgi:hypothetical protein